MTDEEFTRKVKEMRFAQVTYYSTPTWNGSERKRWLIRSKQLESEVDREISRRDWETSGLFAQRGQY